MLCQYSSTFFFILIIVNVATDGSRPSRPSGNNADQYDKGQLVSVKSDEVNDKRTITINDEKLHVPSSELNNDYHISSDYELPMEFKDSSKDDISLIQADDVRNKEIITPLSKERQSQAIISTMPTAKIVTSYRTILNSLGRSVSRSISSENKKIISKNKITTAPSSKTLKRQDNYTEMVSKSNTLYVQSTKPSVNKNLPRIHISSMTLVKLLNMNTASSATQNNDLKNQNTESELSTKSPNVAVEADQYQYKKITTSERHTFSNNASFKYINKTVLNSTSSGYARNEILTQNTSYITKTILKNDLRRYTNKEVLNHNSLNPNKSVLNNASRSTLSNEIVNYTIENPIATIVINASSPYTSQEILSHNTTYSSKTILNNASMKYQSKEISDNNTTYPSQTVLNNALMKYQSKEILGHNTTYPSKTSLNNCSMKYQSKEISDNNTTYQSQTILNNASMKYQSKEISDNNTTYQSQTILNNASMKYQSKEISDYNITYPSQIILNNVSTTNRNNKVLDNDFSTDTIKDVHTQSSTGFPNEIIADDVSSTYSNQMFENTSYKNSSTEILSDSMNNNLSTSKINLNRTNDGMHVTTTEILKETDESILINSTYNLMSTSFTNFTEIDIITPNSTSATNNNTGNNNMNVSHYSSYNKFLYHSQITSSTISSTSLSTSSSTFSSTPLDISTQYSESKSTPYDVSQRESESSIITPLNIVETYNIRIMSPRRVEYNEDDIKDIFWPCPPEENVSNDTFIWYKLSNESKEFYPLGSTIDPQTNTLEIKNPTTKDEGRYVCLSRQSAPFINSKLFFYQFIILKAKWIDIGSSKNISVYFNQKLILNCPHGNIIKNGVKYVSSCPSRDTLIEHNPQTTQDVYRCSDLPNETIKLFAINSSENCSISLLGCQSKKEMYDVVNPERCLSQRNDSLDTGKVERCQGKIFIRFYYNIIEETCIPYETNLCTPDYHSFSSSAECEHHCSIVHKEIQPCFYTQNIDSDQTYDDTSEGVYMTSYNIINNECEWFLHRNGCQISKNTFTSLRKCRHICIKNKRLIKMEMKKVCNYNYSETTSDLTLIIRWIYLPSINTCVQKNISITGEPFVMSFTSKLGCLMCRAMTSKDICGTKPNNGKCKKEEIKWHFNSLEGKCIRILDGGCGDSLNRFTSKRDCLKMCSKFLMTSTSRSKLNLNTNLPYNTKTTARTSYPTTIFRRVNREIQNFQERHLIKTTPSSIVTKIPKAFDPSKRMLDSDPCLGKAILGVCDYGRNHQNFTLIRYSFESKNARCIRVLYSGCMGGDNLFEDANDCRASCMLRLYKSLKSAKCKSPSNSNCISQSSDTNEHAHRYHYSSKEDQCFSFPSVNSDKCLNMFFTVQDDCYKTCRPNPPSEALLQNKCFGKMVIDESSCVVDQKINLWFYMFSIKQCLQYSSCPVQLEGNVFLTKIECEENCKTSNIFTVCNLPADQGMGMKIKTKYFYDNQRRKCRIFAYNGSMGNLNRFRTMEECNKICGKLMIEMNLESHSSSVIETAQNFNYDYQGTFTNVLKFNSETDREYCFDTLKFGACSHFHPQVFITKYYYNAFRQQCEPYLYSGCGATSRNSFESITICDKMCTNRIQKTVSSACSRKPPRCPNSTWIYWVYNNERGICELFPSCIHRSPNDLFFTDEESCSRLCIPSLPQKKDLFDICHLPPTMTQSCSLPLKRWFYDNRSGFCVPSLSCETYGNNFASLAACQLSCDPRDLQDVCKLPEDSGPCSSNSTLLYFFNWKSQRCITFSYGGCLGNRNRFSSLKDCQAICPTRNRCNIQTMKTKCRVNLENSVDIFLYNSNENKCRKINETLCGNYFDFYTYRIQCENDCVILDEIKTMVFSFDKKIPKVRDNKCEESVKFNNYQICSKTQDWLPRFYYDEEKQECTFFYYNGCDGLEDKGNRFSSFEVCRDTCYNVPESTTTTITTQSTTSTANNMQNKKGVCPKPDYTCLSLVSVNRECKRDVDCSLDLKCCECDFGGSLVSQCMEAVGCMLSSFGCCTGTEIAAPDLIHMNCSKSPPRLSYIPETIEIKQNNTTLNIEAFITGDPRPNISWIHLYSKRSITTETRWDLIQPMWSSILKLNVSSPFLNGIWICRASNEMGEDDIEFIISTSSKSLIPSILLYDRQNLNSSVKYVTVNGNSILHCPIYGLPRPSISWFHNNKIITSNNEHLNIQGRYIFFNHIPLSFEGSWVCIGEQFNRSLIFAIQVIIREQLQILPSPHGNVISAVAGQKIVLFCNVIDKPRPNITWIMTIEGVKIKLLPPENDDKRIFVISDFNYNKRGEYICNANNNVSEDSMSFFVIAVEANDIVIEPAGFHFIGDHITLHCPAKPRVKIQHVLWKKDSVYMKTTGLRLNFILHSKLDSGFYTCHHGGRSYKTHIYVHQKNLD